MPEKILDFPDDLYQKIKGLFGDDAVNPFVIIAVEEFISWLIAEQRPTSISELETSRIYKLYLHIYKYLLPTAEDIGRLFHLPMGRARYVVQNLNYQYPNFMKQRQIATIIAAFERKEISEDGLPVAIIPKECKEYLLAITTEMVLSNPRQIQTIPTFKRVTEGVRVELGVDDRPPLLARLQAEEKKINSPDGE